MGRRRPISPVAIAAHPRLGRPNGTLPGLLLPIGRGNRGRASNPDNDLLGPGPRWRRLSSGSRYPPPRRRVVVRPERACLSVCRLTPAIHSESCPPTFSTRSHGLPARRSRRGRVLRGRCSISAWCHLPCLSGLLPGDARYLRDGGKRSGIGRTADCCGARGRPLWREPEPFAMMGAAFLMIT